MGKFIDVTGMKFGRLEVLKRIENTSCKATMWLCKCECGQEGRYISASDAAEIVGVNKTTVARWCREGKVKSMEDIFFLKERMKGRNKDV